MRALAQAARLLGRRSFRHALLESPDPESVLALFRYGETPGAANG